MLRPSILYCRYKALFALSYTEINIKFKYKVLVTSIRKKKYYLQIRNRCKAAIRGKLVCLYSNKKTHIPIDNIITHYGNIH